MNYSDVRSSIKSGDLLAFSHEGWNSWHDFKIQMVRMATRSEFSHVGVAVVLNGRVMVLEAVVPYVRLYPLSRLGDFYLIPLETNWTPEVEEKSFTYIGNPYSQIDAIKAFFSNLGKGSVSECAALALTVLGEAGVNLGERATPDAVVHAAQELGSPLFLIKN